MIYVYKRGEVICECLVADLPKQDLPHPDPPDDFGDPPTPGEILEHLKENGYTIEKVTVEASWVESQASYKRRMDEKLEEIYEELCSEKYLGIQGCTATRLFFEIACRENRDWKEGYHGWKFLEQVPVKFESYCRLMEDHLLPLPGCHIHNSRIEGTRHLFSHWTEFEEHSEENFKARIQEFLEEDKHSDADTNEIARRFYHAAMSEKRDDLLPQELLELVSHEPGTVGESDSQGAQPIDL
jgi:hypothetical protein